MAIRTELSLRLSNNPGALGRVCDTLATLRIDLVAVCLDAGGTLRLVVDNPVLAAGTLREQRYEVAERDVLYTTVPNEAGALTSVLRLATEAGVNVEYAYCSCTERASIAAVVLGVADAEQASARSGI